MSQTEIDYPLPAPNTVTGEVFQTDLKGVMTQEIRTPSSFLQDFWSRYQQRAPVINGNVFEHLVSIALYRQNVRPLYQQANIAFVPNVIFDLAIFTEEHGPVILSLKTSLRERYKQVALEGIVLRNVYRRARTFLITADENEADTVNEKIESYDVQGIEKVVYAFGKDMDDLVFTLLNLKMKKPGTADILTARRTLSESSNP